MSNQKSQTLPHLRVGEIPKPVMTLLISQECEAVLTGINILLRSGWRKHEVDLLFRRDCKDIKRYQYPSLGCQPVDGMFYFKFSGIIFFLSGDEPLFTYDIEESRIDNWTKIDSPI